MSGEIYHFRVFPVFIDAGDCGHGRYLCRPLCRSACGKKHRGQAYGNAADDSDDADAE